jgi:hypothetical protein
MNVDKTTRHTVFGQWFFSNPQVVRMRILDDLEKLGVPKPTARTWMYRNGVPRKSVLRKIELITGENAETLFPVQ